ncbi:hypothetical protein [Streptosporangium sp. NPDC020145]|uniref:hypothetical protein n=1 Tax=Streptosporangium sp. NPDC020145 TaxID=3154694 RepID=UPI00341636B8
MQILAGVFDLLKVALVPTTVYVGLMTLSALVAIFSKKKVRRDMAWKVFNALIRRRADLPSLSSVSADKLQK